MNPAKVDRSRVKTLTDLPNIGPALAVDLRRLGIREPGQLVGRDPFEMYEQLCALTGSRHDPCVIDVFISVTRFMDGETPRPWWEYTAQRKRLLGRGDKAPEPRHVDLLKPTIGGVRWNEEALPLP